MPLALRTVTFPFTIAAPEGSLMKPEMLPRSDCAKALAASNPHNRRASTKVRIAEAAGGNKVFFMSVPLVVLKDRAMAPDNGRSDAGRKKPLAGREYRPAPARLH